MNKKQFLIATVAALLSVSSVSATDITGVTGNNGIFNIDPSHVNGDVGYRQYDNFNLSQGDIANLIFKYGNSRDIETFINLVNNGVKIDGILNTMRDGNFYNGHAVFITPGGMAIGASGVLNVGTLSVITPTEEKYNTLKGEYDARNYTNINNISNLLNNEANVGNITVEGKILARNGIQLRGGDIAVAEGGALINGIKSNQAFTDKSTALNDANTLFNSLVNTDGIKTASAFTTNGTNIQIKSSGSTDIAGTVVNGAAKAGQANNGLYITSNGGTNISGLVQSTNELNVYNKAGALDITGSVKNEGANLNISNKGTDLTVNGKLSTDKDLAITNNGTGALTLGGSAVAQGANNIVNEGAGGMNITGAVNGGSIRIVNRGGKMVISNTADKVASAGTVRLENSGSGMEVGGVKSDSLVSIENKAGDLTVNGKVSVDDGAINILNSGSGKLAISSKGNVAGNGTVSIKNRGTNGMTIDGTVTNNGIDAETAINNEAGAMLVNGKIQNMGNMAIENRGNGTGLTFTKNATVTNEGQLKIKNYGNDGMTIVGDIDNTGRLTIYNDAGELALKNDSENSKGGSITNRDGALTIWSRNNSTGISTSTLSNITNEGAGYNLAIKHDGKTAEGSKGMDLQGTINSEGETAINNYSGDMYVSGDITSEGNLGIINRAGGGSMTLASDGTITNDTANTNIKNYGSGDMTVNNEITSGGRLNILANTGKLNLGGKVHNNSNGNLDANNGFYAAAREDGTGVNVTSGFSVDGQGQNLIKNISGSEGLRFEGNVNTSSSQTELYNMKGDMTVGGNINTTNGNAVILNKGDKLTANGTISSEKDVKVVNKGSVEADVENAQVTTPNEGNWFWEQLKKIFN